MPALYQGAAFFPGAALNWSWGPNRRLQTRLLAHPAFLAGTTWQDLTHRHDGTIQGATVPAFATRPGGWGAFVGDGVGRFISLGDDDVFTYNSGGQDLGFSLCGWFYIIDITLEAGLIAKSNDTGNSEEWFWRVNGSNANVSMLVGDGPETNYIGSNSPITVAGWQGQWVHLAATYDGSESSSGFMFYRNGVPQTQVPFSNGAYTGMTNGTRPVVIGAYSGPSHVLSGAYDDIRIHGTTLTDAEIAAIYADSAAGSPESLAWQSIPLFTSPTTARGLDDEPWLYYFREAA